LEHGGVEPDVVVTAKTVPALRASLTICAVSFVFMARGFSQTTCLPARSAARDIPQWNRFGEVM